MSFDRDTKQVKTRRITINSVMRAKFFQIGVRDFHAKTWRDLWGDDAQYQWHYERGRQFAACTRIKHITKTGARVDADLIQMYQQHMGKGGIL